MTHCSNDKFVPNAGQNDKVVTPLSPLEAILATAQNPTPSELIGITELKIPDAPLDVSKLRGKKAQALINLLRGYSIEDTAEFLKVDVGKVRKFAERAEIKHCIAQSQRVVLNKLQRGEFGPIPMAKHAAEHAMATLITLTQRARNENVKRQSAIDVLALAGHVAVKKAEILNVNELIDAMNAAELDNFIKEGVWPDRLRDRAALLSITKKPREIDITPHK